MWAVFFLCLAVVEPVGLAFLFFCPGELLTVVAAGGGDAVGAVATIGGMSSSNQPDVLGKLPATAALAAAIAAWVSAAVITTAPSPPTITSPSGTTTGTAVLVGVEALLGAPTPVTVAVPTVPPTNLVVGKELNKVLLALGAGDLLAAAGGGKPVVFKPALVVGASVVTLPPALLFASVPGLF